jgi:hypothetical protein
MSQESVHVFGTLSLLACTSEASKIAAATPF